MSDDFDHEDDWCGYAGGIPLPDHLRRDLGDIKLKPNDPVGNEIRWLLHLHPETLAKWKDVDIRRLAPKAKQDTLQAIKDELGILPIKTRRAELRIP